MWSWAPVQHHHFAVRIALIEDLRGCSHTDPGSYAQPLISGYLHELPPAHRPTTEAIIVNSSLPIAGSKHTAFSPTVTTVTPPGPLNSSGSLFTVNKAERAWASLSRRDPAYTREKVCSRQRFPGVRGYPDRGQLLGQRRRRRGARTAIPYRRAAAQLATRRPHRSASARRPDTAVLAVRRPGDHGAYTIAVLREDNGRGGSRFIHDELVRRGLHLTVPGDTSLLETLLAAGVDVQYFGWCRLARCCDSAHRIPAVTCNDLPL
jgi:hypothetical protein